MAWRARFVRTGIGRRFAPSGLFRWAVAAALVAASGSFVASAAEVELSVVDARTGEPLAVRMTLTTPAGRPLVPRQTVAWHDHFVFDGLVRLRMPTGVNRFTLHRGLEYRGYSGYFESQRGGEDSKLVRLERFADLAAEGWWSADLDVPRAETQLPLLMLAEDLHVVWGTAAMPRVGGEGAAEGSAQEVAPSANRPGTLPELNSPIGPLEEAGRALRPESHETEGSWIAVGTERGYDRSVVAFPPGEESLLIAHRTSPPMFHLSLTMTGNSTKDIVAVLPQARQADAYVSVLRPYHWDLPVWVAHGWVDSLAVLHGELLVEGQSSRASGYLPDRIRYPAPRGLGRWSQDIYFALLNCGLHITPVAASGSGRSTNPVGHHRCYVWIGPEFDYGRWWDGLEAGRVVITNGPLLRPNVDGHPPGHTFTAASGQRVVLRPTLNLATRQPVEYLEVLKNGRPVHQVRLSELAERRGELPSVEFDESGWLAVRAVTSNTQTYEYALSGPYYVQIGDQPRISRGAVEFFMEWLDKRAGRGGLEPDVLERAQRFWADLLARANAE